MLSFAFVVAGRLAAQELECPPGATLETREAENARVEMCVGDAGDLDGPAREFRGGVLRREDSWVHGVRHGGSAVYDENGVKREERWHQAGELEASETYFHANGERKSVTQYLQGEKQGDIGEWDESGRPLVRGHFFADRAEGVWLFTPPGEAAYVRVFVAGQAVTPLDPSDGCVGWERASAPQREQLAADLALGVVDSIEGQGRRAASGPTRYRLRVCLLEDLGRIGRALDASCASEARELLGDSSTDAVAAFTAECMLGLPPGPSPPEERPADEVSV